MYDRNDLHDDYNAAYRDARASLSEMDRAPRTAIVGGVWVAGEKGDERGC